MLSHVVQWFKCLLTLFFLLLAGFVDFEEMKEEKAGAKPKGNGKDDEGKKKKE